jgi:hypothetical protein
VDATEENNSAIHRWKTSCIDFEARKADEMYFCDRFPEPLGQAARL